MIRGLYTAASGMMTEVTRQETITNNIANSETNGFKKDLTMQRSLSAANLVRTDKGKTKKIGSLDWGTLIDAVHTAHEQGMMQQTDRSLDLALIGSGYFVVETADGLRYTRNGAFTLDAERYLTDESGHRVVGSNGLLQLPEGDVRIDGTGRIYVNGDFSGQLRLAGFTNPQTLQKEGDALFAAGGLTEETEADVQVRQGFLEGSNVEVAEEMINMMAALRAYQSNQRVLQAQDELLGKAVNEIGSLR